VALLESALRGETGPVLRFYGWEPPALSLGRFQGMAGIALEPLRQRGWELVRRPTGGRGVLHHLEVTYSIVLPPDVVAGCGVRSSYAVLVEALNRGLAEWLPRADGPGFGGACGGALRVANCFALADECDTVAQAGKLVGSAQMRRGGGLLQHGSLLLDADREVWTAVFGDAGRMTTLRDLLGYVPAPEEAAERLAAGFAELGARLSCDELSATERAESEGRWPEFALPL
jgi:lipoate-protein ligase A